MFLTLFGSFLAVVAADPDGLSPVAAGTAAVTGYLLVGRLLVHEGGHLLAAILMRLPVTAVRLRLVGGPSRVECGWPARRRWLPVRVLAFTSAGPAAELLLAAGAYQGFLRADGSATRAALLTVTVSAGVSALQNLVPHRLGDGLRSDGASMLRWLLRRLWQGRIAEARELSRDLCRDTDGPEARWTGLLVRALVEGWSTGDAGAAGPLLHEAVRAGCPSGLAWLAGQLPRTPHADRHA